MGVVGVTGTGVGTVGVGPGPVEGVTGGGVTGDGVTEGVTGDGETLGDTGAGGVSEPVGVVRAGGATCSLGAEQCRHKSATGMSARGFTGKERMALVCSAIARLSKGNLTQTVNPRGAAN